MSKWMITFYQPYDVGFEVFNSKEEAEEKYGKMVEGYFSDDGLLKETKIMLSEIKNEEVINKNRSHGH